MATIAASPGLGGLFWKHAVLFATVIGLALVTNSMIEIWFTYREHRAYLYRSQQEQASSAAVRISEFIQEIEGQLGWMTHLAWSNTPVEQRQIDGLRLFRQVPAITDLTLLDDKGREQLRMTRQEMDRVGSNIDYATTDKFNVALAKKVYYGAVYFRRETEPYMTLAVSGARRDAGVAVAEVNLTHIWDVVHQIRVGETGRAWVVDTQGRLIAHPDISLVLGKTDMSRLAQVARARANPPRSEPPSQIETDIRGERVLTAHATADPLKWLVFVELPEREANERLTAAVRRSIIVMFAGLFLALCSALILARRMVGPIELLTTGAARIGSGFLEHRIAIATGDELETLGHQFNDMAAKLQDSQATLERKVDERTGQLQVANFAKSRFLAVASHDLRQPLHALSLFAAQLRSTNDPAERSLITEKIGVAVHNMNELLNALLDLSKLDAQGLHASVSEFPINGILERIEITFAAAALEKGLHMRIVRSSARVRSDAILLERILANLTANAIRYTPSGGVVVGCRRMGGSLRLDVYDSGIGITEEEQRNIFSEFYQIANTTSDLREGLGLGLAIVERLCRLLDHPIELRSIPGQGSCFSLMVPLVPAQSATPGTEAPAAGLDPLPGKHILLIDDDDLVLEATRGLLEAWGCRVVTAQSAKEAVGALRATPPDLIISDYRLGNGPTGIEAVDQVRRACARTIPAVLVSGDMAKSGLQQARASGLVLLHKPVNPMSLRAIMTSCLKSMELD
ncbi:MAG: ATP-binding protein [Hyphomicrobiaceae bacterium]